MLGSSARRKIAIWTNGARAADLMHDYKESQRHGPALTHLLADSELWQWRAWSDSQEYLPKLVSRAGSYQFSYQRDGTPGPGLLLHNGTFKEPCPVRELAMGFTKGATAAPGAPDSLRNMVLGACVDGNIARWIMGALQRHRSLPGYNGASFLSHGDITPIPNHSRNEDWIVDGGATSHITAHRGDFITYKRRESQLWSWD